MVIPYPKNNWFNISLSLTQKHPGFIYENFISGYDNINWMQSLKLVENKSIDLKISNSLALIWLRSVTVVVSKSSSCALDMAVTEGFFFVYH